MWCPWHLNAINAILTQWYLSTMYLYWKLCSSFGQRISLKWCQRWACNLVCNEGVPHARLRYTQDYLLLGLCSTMGHIALICHFPPQTMQSYYNHRHWRTRDVSATHSRLTGIGLWGIFDIKFKFISLELQSHLRWANVYMDTVCAQ